MNKPAKLPTVEQALDEMDASNTLHGAMALAFAEIEAATKSADNPFFKSKYADLPAIIGAVKPALVKYRLFFTQSCHPSESGVIVETVLHHANGESMSLGQLYVPANKHDAQGFGSAQTYARRYALQTAFGVPVEDDDGNAAAKASQARPSEGASRPVNGDIDKDPPFPMGPAHCKTALKEMARAFWRDIEAAGDSDELEIVLADKDNQKMVKQLIEALPTWWSGGVRKVDGGGTEKFEGLEAVIARKRREFEQENA
jgi:hypothetical protein